jgi:flagellar basal body rod protein FlgB
MALAGTVAEWRRKASGAKVDVPNLTNSGPIPLLEKTLAFAEARQRMLATNIANLTTPGYRAKRTRRGAFQRTRRAAKKREATARSIWKRHASFA